MATTARVSTTEPILSLTPGPARTDLAAVQ
uniref:Uncharacterized protein n=1 Tax=Arundo donax TaxID=35708 RepID=A0A0A9AY35_ARUDO